MPARFAALAAAVAAVAVSVASATGSAAATVTSVDWLGYLHDAAHSGMTPDNVISTSNATALKARSGWPKRPSLWPNSAQPVAQGGLTYQGSWDGYLRAFRSDGSTGWATNLGQTQGGPGCGAPGVASTPSSVTLVPPGQTTARPVLVVGGGGTNTAGGGYARLYGVDAGTGHIYWHTNLGAAPNTFIWSSPALWTHSTATGTATSAYIGTASLCDNPLIPAAVVQLDARTGAIQHTFRLTPSGCAGNAVWGSPTVDTADGLVFVATGNAGACGTAQPYGQAVVALHLTDLSLAGAWQVPASEVNNADSDFGSTPTLFQGTVTTGGTLRRLIGVANKNGTYYVFAASRVAAGPLARLHVAVGGDNPENGDGSISPSAWDGARLYVAGGRTTIGGVAVSGAVRAYNPNNLSSPVWARALPGPVLGALTASPGLVAVPTGTQLQLLASATGALLWRGNAAVTSSGTQGTFWGGPTIAHGVLRAGDMKGYVYQWSVNGL